MRSSSGSTAGGARPVGPGGQARIHPALDAGDAGGGAARSSPGSAASVAAGEPGGRRKQHFQAHRFLQETWPSPRPLLHDGVPGIARHPDHGQPEGFWQVAGNVPTPRPCPTSVIPPKEGRGRVSASPAAHGGFRPKRIALQWVPWTRDASPSAFPTRILPVWSSAASLRSSMPAATRSSDWWVTSCGWAPTSSRTGTTRWRRGPSSGHPASAAPRVCRSATCSTMIAGTARCRSTGPANGGSRSRPGPIGSRAGGTSWRRRSRRRRMSGPS